MRKVSEKKNVKSLSACNLESHLIFRDKKEQKVREEITALPNLRGFDIETKNLWNCGDRYFSDYPQQTKLLLETQY